MLIAITNFKIHQNIFTYLYHFKPLCHGWLCIKSLKNKIYHRGNVDFGFRIAATWTRSIVSILVFLVLLSLFLLLFALFMFLRFLSNATSGWYRKLISYSGYFRSSGGCCTNIFGWLSGNFKSTWKYNILMRCLRVMSFK